jgi:heterotetrameric sarcosine oxidase gamma subunit
VSVHNADAKASARRVARSIFELGVRRGQEAALGAALGLPLPPPGRARANLLRLSPVQLLFLAESVQIDRALASVNDQSSGLACFELVGPDIRAALAAMCRVDLHDAAFAVGSVARTSMAQMPIVLWRTGTNEFCALAQATLAQSFAEALGHAGIVVTTP